MLNIPSMVGKHCNVCRAKCTAFARENAASDGMVKITQIFCSIQTNMHGKNYPNFFAVYKQISRSAVFALPNLTKTFYFQA